MFYATAENAHGLAHDPFKAIVSPRPIGWIGSRSADGSLNLAPYSFFNAISDAPKLSSPPILSASISARR